MAKCVKCYVSQYVHLAKSEDGKWFWRHWIRNPYTYGYMWSKWREVTLKEIKYTSRIEEGHYGAPYTYRSLDVTMLVKYGDKHHYETALFVGDDIPAVRKNLKLRLPEGENND
jgi:hypothetical protein